MHTRVQSAVQKPGRKGAGMTVSGLPVMILIIGLFLLVSSTLILNHNAAKATNDSIRSDLESAMDSVLAFSADQDTYPTAASQVDFTPSDGNLVSMFIVDDSGEPGYVLYGENSDATAVYVLSSFSTVTPQTTNLLIAPVAPHSVGPEAQLPAAGTLSKAMVWQ